MKDPHNSLKSSDVRDGLDIAIVGMAGRFPGAKNIAEFWNNVRGGVESLSVLDDKDLVNAGVPESLLRDPNYVRRRGIMEGIDLFDAGFFGITPREAELMDPQQRLFLECAWETLEHAGYDPEQFNGPVGVYAGSSSSGYLFNLFPRGVLLQSAADMAAILGVEKDSLATRVSYKLNLEGPSLAVQTACSTSLVAVHLACQGLLAGECDMALAGGISITVPQTVGYLYQKGGIASPDGHCRAFDAQAQGTVGGSGVGLVLLRRLQDAQDDGDHILAVIRGSAINNDGARKVGYTAPRVEGQVKVIRAAQIAAEVDPRSIGYIEAHGTGTPMGDPIELAALTQAFRAQTDQNNFCAIGSVKTNIGHLDAAAGVVGLIKTVLALSHKQIPPSLHFTKPNPEIEFSATPFFVNTVLREWTRNGTPRRAGVSSFGLGGTNAHVVLEEAPPQNRTASSRPWHLLPLSARSASALDIATARLRDQLAQNEHEAIADIAYTLQVGRRHFPYRRILWCRDRQDASRILAGQEPSRLLTSQPVPSNRPVAFLFPGQGAQHVDMASELYREEPRFKEEVDRCIEVVRPLLGCEVREILYPERGAAEAMSARLNQTSLTQPVLFMIEYALAKLWMAWGVKPEAMIGHSIGEYVAACLSGVFSLEEALRLVAERGRLIQSLPAGSMLAVVLSEREVAEFQGRCSLAAVNGPRLSVLSGTPDEIDAAGANLAEKGIAFRRLHVSHAFHSSMMNPILQAFKQVLDQVTFGTPTIPFLSNVSGRWMSTAEATDPNYWVRHLRQTVRFSAGLQELMNQSNRILLEVGPGDTLSVLARRQFTERAASDPNTNDMPILSSLPHPHKGQPGQAHLWESLGKIWLAGAAVDWSEIHRGERRGRVPLPTYPFERQRYWVEAERDRSWSPSSGGEAVDSVQTVPPIVSRPNQGHERPVLTTPYCAPQNDVERQLVTIWQELLRIDHIGIHDSFFELGGESLVAVQLLSHIRTAFKREVSPAEFFEIPTVVGLSRILNRHESGEISASEAPSVVSPRDHAAETPLSYAQERLWFLDQLEVGSSFYHLSAALHIHGSLNTEAVVSAFDRIVNRHEILRTAFTVRDGRPVQIIESKGCVQVTIQDLGDEQGQETIVRLAKEEARRPFRLDQSPLMRITLLKVRDQEHVLLITMHHIISDGWSLGVLMREFAAYYVGSVGDDSVIVPPLAIQYADYAHWQRRWYSGEALNRALDYWKAKLEGWKPTLALPTDRPRPAVQSYRGTTYRMALPPSLTESLKSLSRRNDTTLFTTLLTAFQVLLYRYSGQEDFCLGTPMANRLRAEIEPLIGFFVNTVVLRSDLSGASSFLDLLSRVRETVLGAQSHQDIPFEKLVEALQPIRDLSYSPIFQVMFSLDRDHLQSATLPGLEVSELPIETQHTRFDLTLDMTESNGAVFGVWEYSTDLFDHSTIERMAGHYQRLLEYIAVDPARSLLELPLLTERERQRALVEWNATECNDLPSCCLHQLVEEQAHQTPDAIAIRFLDQTVTYQDMDERADVLAGSLRAMGVGPDVMVGLCVERSPAMIIGMLGILKAGAAYVPIDPEYPEARIALMVNDAGMKVLLAQQHLLGALPHSHASVLCVDHHGRLLSEKLPRLNGQAGWPDQLAYVIYTSGSSGRPKGVAVSHRNAVNFLHAMREPLSFDARDAVLAVTSLSFDIAVLELFLPLTAGATIVLADRETSHDGEKLLALLNSSRATVMQATPATWRMLLQAGWTGTERLKILCGGEALSLDLTDRLLKLGQELWNLYGPTETTVWSAACQVLSAVPPILIGRPIANTEIYIVDAGLQPVPVGVAGEIYIGGVGVARGYWNRPDLTGERFIPDPFARRSGRRLYRTGDLGRWRPDGTIECLGRIDYQVKVRGYRIEPGEIESRLVEHPQIIQAVVTVHDDGLGEKRLVGYVVSTEPVASGELRDFLRDRLPEYMVPSIYLLLDQFPLTPNGKIDRNALPPPDDVNQSSRRYEAPRTATEATLAEIWRAVLGVEQVGIHDNFFELGGDSILSIQVVSRVRQRGISITPRQLFQQQTIAELAGVVSQMPQSSAEDSADTDEFVLTPIQQWYFDLGAPNVHQWNQSLLLDLKRPLDPSIVTQVMDHLMVHHDALRLRFEQRDGCWTQRYAEKSDQSIVHVVDLSSISAAGQRVALNWEIDSWETSLNIIDGPQLRVVYLKMGETQPDKLLLIIHHLVTDGISWRILMEDFHRAYAQIVAKEPVTLPTKSTSYARWARRLLDYAQSKALNGEVAYWLDPARLQVAPIPVDFPAGDRRELSSETIHFWLGEAETHALLHEVPSAHRTQINDLLLTSLVRTLAGWSNRQELLIDLEGHGREDLFSDLDLSRTIGWFAGVSPILLSYSTDETLVGSLKSIKEQLRRFPQGGIGYGLLRYLSPSDSIRERLTAYPPSQIRFNYLGQMDHVLRDDSPFVPSIDAAGIDRDPQAVLPYELDINSDILRKRLHMSWTYSSWRYNRQTVELLGRTYLNILTQLIRHCLEPGVESYTPSDFPLSGLDQSGIDHLLAGTRRDIEDVYPLTGLQRGMLFHSLEKPEDGLYIEQLHCTLVGACDPFLLRQALQETINRHPSLRTSFLWEGLQEPLQVVHTRVSMPIKLEDWRDNSLDVQRERFCDLLQDYRSLRFDLSTAPLIRVGIVRLSENETRFVWAHHHLLMDGWCVALILREVFDRYASLQGGASTVVVPAQPYRHYIAWLRKQDGAPAEAHWRATLAGFKAPTPLFATRRDSVAQSGEARQYGKLSKQLSEELSIALTAFTQKHKVTLNTVMQGAWALLLSRYSGESDVLFGVTVSGRPADLAGVETIIGLFLNTLPLRVRISPSLSAKTWLKQLMEQNIAMREFEHASLTQIQRWSDMPKGQSLFESLFVFENYPMGRGFAGAHGGLTVADVIVENKTHYPLMVNVGLEPLTLRVTYDRCRFEEDLIIRMVRRFENLLHDLTRSPDQALSTLSMLSAAERNQLLVDWNRTEANFPHEGGIQQLFERQVVKNPDAIAVSFEKQALTYRELNQRANQLAHFLRRNGVGPDVLIGICMERSLEMIVAVIGILKAGGAYVPIDPGYPAARIAFLFQDSQAALILTQERLISSIPAHEGGKLVCLDRDWPSVVEYPINNPSSINRSDNTAYVIYTSGSTGVPKGVMVPHAGLINYLQWCTQTYRVVEGHGSPVHSSLSFDLTVTSLWSPLLVGRAVHLLSERDGPEGLGVALQEQRDWSLVKLTPAHLKLIPGLVSANEVAGRTKAFIIGGEALLGEDLAFWTRHASSTRLINEYGPTETVVGCCVYEVSPGTFPSGGVPIGRPIANTCLYVLDEHLEPVPVGVSGELYIGGAGVARGYLNRPSVTAERFLPHPFSDRPGERLYRTGDVVKYLPDGNLFYLGRTDYQVKLRGYRIELGEIEAVLCQQPDVQDGVVLLREDQPGEKRLVAYVVASATGILSEELLREALQKHLPEHMLPATYVFLDQLPLTSNGKVDKLALPVPGTSNQASPEYEDPRTTREKLLAEIWAEVLGVERVGIHDNFFGLGGDSILGIQTAFKARQKGIVFTPRHLFQHQTIAALSEVATSTEFSFHDGQVLAQGNMPLTPIQQRFFEQALHNPHQHTQAVLLELKPGIEATLLEKAIAVVVGHHDAFRLRFNKDSGIWQQVYQMKVFPPKLHHVDLTSISLSELPDALEASTTEHQANIHVTEGPLFQAVLFDVDKGQSPRLLIVVHQLIVDSMSWRILLEDLTNAYQALAVERPIVFPAKTASFKKWSEWLNDLSGEETSQQELDYWLTPIRKQVKPLPVDGLTAESNEITTESVVVSLTEEETQLLLQDVSLRRRTPVNDVLLAGLVQVLARWNNDSVVLIDVEGQGREDICSGINLSRTIGWFTSMFPVAVQIPRDATPLEALTRLQEELQRLPRKGCGYGLLRYLNSDHDVRKRLELLPSPQVRFKYWWPDAEVELINSLFDAVHHVPNSKNDSPYAFDLMAHLSNKRMNIVWRYNSTRYRHDTIRTLTHLYIEALKVLIDHRLLINAREYVPEDFPDVDIDQETLGRVFEEMG
ncbi:MAG: amino acid adenylation domain-containing protein [Nitrospira sp.]|nr:amino acid adenylation domain-containing protein [Nitrospira sp.]